MLNKLRRKLVRLAVIAVAVIVAVQVVVSWIE